MKSTNKTQNPEPTGEMTAAQRSKPMTKNQRQQQSKSSQRLLLLLPCFCLRFYFIFCFCHFSGAKELGSNTKLLGLGQALLRTHINILNVSFLFTFLLPFFRFVQGVHCALQLLLQLLLLFLLVFQWLYSVDDSLSFCCVKKVKCRWITCRD